MKTNVAVHLLPPNTTEHLRDAGIINSFKVGNMFYYLFKNNKKLTQMFYKLDSNYLNCVFLIV